MLRVTKLTDYATVVLTVLAARPGQVLSATELAEAAGLEATTVAKLLKPLAQAGLVIGLRGVNGGYRLARDAAAISLIEVVQAMEGPLAITECSQDHNNCGIAHQCGVRSQWRLINDVLADALRSVTLAQMLQPTPDMPAARAISAALVP
jgi:FeS assembly SUF system regulator